MYHRIKKHQNIACIDLLHYICTWFEDYIVTCITRGADVHGKAVGAVDDVVGTMYADIVDA